MEALELKFHIHQIVDAIQNEQVLQTLYDFLKSKENEKDGSLWESLNEEQKKEVMLAFEESEDEGNLVDAKTVFRNFR
ncbi:hypothetical protein GO621_05410 [Mucilaginibacter sp. HMF7410]|uniref:Addiction module component n=2 Tax=Mucilaginibacter arboris TaxID=2682090 RepID=A0A7K1SUM6_9SPHI|nr:hypothetical protein [Mucilaginibacter arboris]